MVEGMPNQVIMGITGHSKEEDQDKQLASKLKQELPQIFLIVREAMKRLMLNQDFTSSPICEAEKQ